MKKEKRKPLIKLKLKRIEKGLTQGKLAEKVGVKRMTIFYYEAGTRRPDYDTLTKLATALDCTVDEIV